TLFHQRPRRKPLHSPSVFVRSLIYAAMQNVFAYRSPIILVIFGSDMRRFFAILGLLTLLIGTAAGELPVIKDSEAVRYVGKYVEVRGLVDSVTSSPLGTVFINFGR